MSFDTFTTHHDLYSKIHLMPESYSLPIFPLDLVLYPGEQLTLHIFEERYKEMIAYCLQEDAPFGIVRVKEEELLQVGCTAVIEDVIARYPDGKMDIMVQGATRFKVQDIDDEKSYLRASVVNLEEPEEPIEKETRERVITQHMRLLELAGHEIRPQLYSNETSLSFFIAHNAGLNADQKQAVLEMVTENERIAYLAGYLARLLPQVEQFEDVRRKVTSNGHFKDFPPSIEDD